MYYRTKDNVLSNVSKFHSIRFEVEDYESESKFPSQGSLSSDPVVEVKATHINSIKILGVVPGHEDEVIDEGLNALSLLVDMAEMSRLGISPVVQVSLSAGGAVPGVDAARYTLVEEGFKDALRKNPVFLVDVSVDIHPMGGVGGQEVVSLRSEGVPLATVIAILQQGRVASVMRPGTLRNAINFETLQASVPEGSFTHYHKEELHRLTAN